MHASLRYAFRQLFKSPGFTAVAVLGLALGIGSGESVARGLIRASRFGPAH